MQKNFLVTAVVCLILVFASCSKVELIKDHFDDDKIAPKNDYLQIREHELIYEYGELVDQGYPFLLKKVYDADGKKLKQLVATYKNLVSYYIGPDAYFTLMVMNSPNQMDFIEPGGDTMASLKFNSQGKIVSAVASILMYRDEPKQKFTFFYNTGKLSEIKTEENGVLRTYAKVEYDNTGKNVRSVTFDDNNGVNNGKVTYAYDYSKKVAAQYVPDDEVGHHFWAFLKYLNILEELKPENLLTGSFLKAEHVPGDQTRVYSEHRFDSKGRLISFRLAEGWGGYTPQPGDGTDWDITWK